jgi:hypothetical protein
MPVFAHLPTWRAVMFLPATEKVAALAKRETRENMRMEVAGATFFNGWQYVVVQKTTQPQHKALEGERA